MRFASATGDTRRMGSLSSASLRAVAVALCLAVSVAKVSAEEANHPHGTQSPPSEENKSMDWKSQIKRLARHGAENIESFTDAAWRRFANKMQFSQPRQIMAYAGYGNDTTVWVQGRVLANKPVRGPQDHDDWWDNLRATYERWETDEIAGADVELIFGEQRQRVTTNDEGYYHATFEVDKEFPRCDVVLAQMQGKNGTITAQHKVTIPDTDAPFMVISDMDDTVIHTGITDILLAARLTFLNNAKTRKPLAGVAGLYREIAASPGGDTRVPIFYVSNSGWNMYDLLRDFIELNDIPQGPILLRDLGFSREGESSKNHKAETFRELLQRYPTLQAVLIGDSGQHDAQLYASLAKEFPDRIMAIYIRDVDPDDESVYDAKVDAIIQDYSGSGVPMLRGKDSDMFAAHMAKIGILPDAAGSSIHASVERDEQRESVKEL